MEKDIQKEMHKQMFYQIEADLQKSGMTEERTNGWDCSRKQGAKNADLKFKRLYILTLIMNRIENNFAMLPCYYVPARKEEKEYA